MDDKERKLAQKWIQMQSTLRAGGYDMHPATRSAVLGLEQFKSLSLVGTVRAYKDGGPFSVQFGNDSGRTEILPMQ